MSESNNDSGAESDDSEPDSERPDRPWPGFYAWCPESNRIDAFIAAVSALVGASNRWNVGDPDDADPTKVVSLYMADAARLMRDTYPRHGYSHAFFELEGCSGAKWEFNASVFSDRLIERSHSGPIGCCSWMGGVLFPSRVALAKKRGRSTVEVAAGVACRMAMNDIYEILMRICTSSAAITTGGCSGGTTWGAPVLMGATYHADGNPVRDLALSWLDLHDGVRAELAAGSSIDTLMARIEAAPRRSSVPLLDEVLLKREEVLAALDLSPNVLVEALQVCAGKTDPAWKAVEPEVLQALDDMRDPAVEKQEGVPSSSDDHDRFIEEHSPVFVRHLDNGAVVLLAHPYRTLWPLWADTLNLLGIRS
ncbi:hypothetical protein [Polyangium spumosum]|uniref:Uncharacterized protein n=1 Tax=Polyangium spumosum TaxID=889282 RepID=A0A6N7PJ19_9BACT|nr:hypothetical protein [Polyangium spumosum]MRG91988.1 hypothetical protein [Polyangium spumosum]